MYNCVFVCVCVCVCVCVSGLEQFSQETSVLKKFESMASGKILLAEILKREETPLMVLYDTSQDDDVNINAACMKALQDKSLGSPLQVPLPTWPSQAKMITSPRNPPNPQELSATSPDADNNIPPYNSINLCLSIAYHP